MGGSIEGVIGESISSRIVDVMLEDYYSNCRYLKEAFYGKRGDYVGAEGVFEIPSSCYCESTGHFNAVEFLICFNQLTYTMLSEAVERGDMPELGADCVEDFKKLQLVGSYITKIKDISFKRKIDPRSFSGNVEIQSRKSMRGANFYKMKGMFADENGGNAFGLMNIAIVP